MKIYRCSESRIQIDDSGTLLIVLPNNVGIVKMSGPETLAVASKVCEIIAEQAKVPENFIERVVESVDFVDENFLEKKS